jgi:hypothetical protein
MSQDDGTPNSASMSSPTPSTKTKIPPRKKSKRQQRQKPRRSRRVQNKSPIAQKPKRKIVTKKKRPRSPEPELDPKQSPSPLVNANNVEVDVADDDAIMSQDDGTPTSPTATVGLRRSKRLEKKES